MLNYPLATCRSSSNVPTSYPPSTDCNGHGNNPGNRDILGGTVSGPNKFRTASEWINAHGGSNVISVSSTGDGFALVGNFLIDKPIVFAGADVRASPDARITVNASMESDGSLFYACEGLWEGIRGQGRVDLLGGTVIEDAKIGVLFTTASEAAIIEGTTFKRNIIGIGYRGLSKVPAKFFRFKQFDGNTFECEKPLNIHPNVNYRWTIAGMTIIAGRLDVVGNGNTFKGKIRIGIEVSLSHYVKIKGCSFNDIEYVDPASGDATIQDDVHLLTGKKLMEGQEGYGVSAQSTKINISLCDFFHCAKGGVSTKWTITSIDDCRFIFYKTYIGTEPWKNLAQSFVAASNIINCAETLGKTIDITNNLFDILRDGAALISVERSDKKVFISNNDLRTRHSTKPLGLSSNVTGIHIYGKKNKTSSINCTLSDNEITHKIFNGQPNRTGVFLDNTDYVLVKNTTAINQPLNFSSFCSNAGIYVKNSSNCKIVNNEVRGKWVSNQNDLATAYLFEGTALLHCRENLICGNVADSIDRGFVFVGDCDMSVFSNNTMKHCMKRLVLSKISTVEPRIGEQLVSGTEAPQDIYNNDPKIPSFLAAGFKDATHEGNKLAFSKFYVIKKGYPNEPQKVQVQAGLSAKVWFDDGTGKVEYNCPQFKLAAGDISKAEAELIAGRFEESAAVWNWENKLNLYGKLTENPNLVGNNQERLNYLNILNASDIAAYGSIVLQMKHLYDVPLATQNQLNTWLAQRESAQTQMDNLISTATAEFGTNDWNEETQVFLSNYMNELQGLDSLINLKMKDLKLVFGIKTNQISSQISQLPANTAYQQDFKTLNNIIMSAVGSEEITSLTVLNKLRTIAAKCPNISGSSVFLARSLLPTCERENYNDDNRCNDVIVSPTSGKVATSALLYPNPSNDAIVLNTKSTDFDRTIELYNLQGQMIKSLQLSANTEVLSISTGVLPEGFYSLRILSPDAQIVEKFVVKH